MNHTLAGRYPIERQPNEDTWATGATAWHVELYLMFCRMNKFHSFTYFCICTLLHSYTNLPGSNCKRMNRLHLEMSCSSHMTCNIPLKLFC